MVLCCFILLFVCLFCLVGDSVILFDLGVAEILVCFACLEA